MRAVDELLDIETVILKSSHSYFKFDDCAFVVVKVTIIGGRKDGDNWGELFGSRPFVHFESFSLSLMSSDDRQNAVLFEEGSCDINSKEVRAPSDVIRFDNWLWEPRFIINRISPHQIAEKPCFGYLSKAINLLDIIKLKIVRNLQTWVHRRFLRARIETFCWWGRPGGGSRRVPWWGRRLLGSTCWDLLLLFPYILVWSWSSWWVVCTRGSL